MLWLLIFSRWCTWQLFFSPSLIYSELDCVPLNIKHRKRLRKISSKGACVWAKFWANALKFCWLVLQVFVQLMRSFECSSSPRARAPSSLKPKQTCWVGQFSSENDNRTLLMFCLLHFPAAEEKCPMLLFPCLLPFLISCIFVYLFWSSLKDSVIVCKRCYPRKQFLLSLPHFTVASARCDEGWLLSYWKSVTVTLTSLGSKLHPRGPMGEMGRNFHFHREFATLNCVGTSNIFFTGQSSSLISDECSGWASSAAGKSLEVH